MAGIRNLFSAHLFVKFTHETAYIFLIYVNKMHI